MSERLTDEQIERARSQTFVASPSQDTECNCGVDAPAQAETPCDEDCMRCSGEYCERHGTDPCDCDVDERHYIPPVPAPAAPAPAGGAPDLLMMWDEAYRAFKGAFDHAIARRKDNSEYANDARRRIYEFNDEFRRAVERERQPLLCDTCGEPLQREACNHVSPCGKCAEERERPLRAELERFTALERHLPPGYAIGDDATAELAVKLAASGAELEQARREREEAREAIRHFRETAGKHDGEHVFSTGLKLDCSRCEESYIKAEAELEAALVETGEPRAE